MPGKKYTPNNALFPKENFANDFIPFVYRVAAVDNDDNLLGVNDGLLFVLSKPHPYSSSEKTSSDPSDDRSDMWRVRRFEMAEAFRNRGDSDCADIGEWFALVTVDDDDNDDDDAGCNSNGNCGAEWDLCTAVIVAVVVIFVAVMMPSLFVALAE